jgi:lysophospholipase L1-like esterase
MSEQLLKMIPILLLALNTIVLAQDPLRFAQEIEQLNDLKIERWNPYKPTVIFTGSSSIRMWRNVQEVFPEFQVINTGFGGSHASDLIYYLDELVLNYNPVKTFIYEGDNDLASGKSVRRTLKDLGAVVTGIRQRNPGMSIVLISAKPSISRWKFRNKYQRFNRKIASWAAHYSNLEFADVWHPMMLESGQLNESLFIEDGLHMNALGYRIWQTTLAPFVSLNL